MIGADCTLRVLNPADKQTYPLFGDGAGGGALAPGDEKQGLLAYAAGSDGSGADLLNRPMGGSRLPFSASAENNNDQYMHMEGRPIFKWSVKMLRETTKQVLQHAGMKVDDLDLVIFHQANKRIIDSAVADSGTGSRARSSAIWSDTATPHRPASPWPSTKFMARAASAAAIAFC